MFRGQISKGVVFAVAGLLLFCFTSAGAVEKVPVMKVAGKVLEISGEFLKIERSLKGNTEVMEFSLENSHGHIGDISVGQQVTVSYKREEMKNILVGVELAKKTAVRKAEKKVAKKVVDKAAPVGAVQSK